MKDKVFQLTNTLGNLERLNETMKESHKIVLDTKESVVRSLLKQNTELSFEKDSLSLKVESLSSSLEHLTGLLRNLQNANIENLKQLSTPEKRVTIKGGGSMLTPPSPLSDRFQADKQMKDGGDGSAVVELL